MTADASVRKLPRISKPPIYPMNIAANMTATVGNTPLIRLNHVTAGLGAEICVKAEFFNPLFSV